MAFPKTCRLEAAALLCRSPLQTVARHKPVHANCNDARHTLRDGGRYLVSHGSRNSRTARRHLGSWRTKTVGNQIQTFDPGACCSDEGATLLLHSPLFTRTVLPFLFFEQLSFDPHLKADRPVSVALSELCAVLALCDDAGLPLAVTWRDPGDPLIATVGPIHYDVS